ncbi:MAG: hypothetical protein HZA93_12500 [Verrucomicrobia bacterium]|nr:hypothetical protein [Verrucomicrobiota bacterium]
MAGAVAAAGVVAQGPAAKVIQAQIVAAQVKGEVEMRVGSELRALKTSEVVPQGARVLTGADSSAVLVFSNGVTLSLAAETELAIEQFLQDPFSAATTVAGAKQEPTVSKTLLNLFRGEIVGQTPQLNFAQGSAFGVRTAVGVFMPPARGTPEAGEFRGGVFRLRWGRPDAAGGIRLVASAGGSPWVFLQPTGGEAKSIIIPPGQQIEIGVGVEVKRAPISPVPSGK